MPTYPVGIAYDPNLQSVPCLKASNRPSAPLEPVMPMPQHTHPALRWPERGKQAARQCHSFSSSQQSRKETLHVFVFKSNKLSDASCISNEPGPIPRYLDVRDIIMPHESCSCPTILSSTQPCRAARPMGKTPNPSAYVRGERI